MPDVDLPPVGELVQITRHDGSTALAMLEAEQLNWLTVIGSRPVHRRDVQSWCRVLVVPDTEKTEALLRRAIADPGQFLPRGDDYAETIPSWGARAVLAAVRGAAIR